MGLDARGNTLYIAVLGGIGAATALYLARRRWLRTDQPKACTCCLIT